LTLLKRLESRRFRFIDERLAIIIGFLAALGIVVFRVVLGLA